MAQEIRDNKGVLKGKIVQEGSTTVLRDARGNKLGYIDSTGKARDARGNLVGNGMPMLMTLLR